MWKYSQTTGRLLAPDGVLEGVGYSGHGPGVNNPFYEDTPNVGPIPQGLYTISPFFNDPQKGRWVCRLIPDPANQMFGRSGFMLHGDAVGHVGEEIASEGCIIMGRAIRQAVAASSDKALLVTS